MPIMQTETYIVMFDVVAINFGDGHTVHMNADTLRLVIDNIHRDRAHYASEQAHQEALRVYETALKLLEA